MNMRGRFHCHCRESGTQGAAAAPFPPLVSRFRGNDSWGGEPQLKNFMRGAGLASGEPALKVAATFRAMSI